MSSNPRFSSGNAVKVLTDIHQTYPEMLKAIDSAQSSVYFANFCMSDDPAFKPFEQALVAAAKRGVDVCVMIDDYGSANWTEERIRQMQSQNIKMAVFRPKTPRHISMYNHRNHKKLLVVDNKVGFTGGVGVAQIWIGDPAYPAPWRDTHFKIEGPVVQLMAAAFVHTWNDWSKHQLEMPADKPKAMGNIKIAAFDGLPITWPFITAVGRQLVRQIDMAKESIDITTAYYGPSYTLISALQRAAKRGVRIRILINGRYTNHRTALQAGRHRYWPVLRCGVEIYEYLPTKIHAKLMVVDGKNSFVGSANLNFRSFFHDEEFNLLIEDEGVARLLTKQFEDDLKSAQQIDPSAWQRRPLRSKTFQAFASLARLIF